MSLSCVERKQGIQMSNPCWRNCQGTQCGHADLRRPLTLSRSAQLYDAGKKSHKYFRVIAAFSGCFSTMLLSNAPGGSLASSSSWMASACWRPPPFHVSQGLREFFRPSTLFPRGTVICYLCLVGECHAHPCLSLSPTKVCAPSRHVLCVHIACRLGKAQTQHPGALGGRKQHQGHLRLADRREI